MAKVNTIANNGLTIVENYNKLLEQFRKTKTIDDVRILVASVRDFISVYKRVDKNMVNEIYEKLGNNEIYKIICFFINNICSFSNTSIK